MIVFKASLRDVVLLWRFIGSCAGANFNRSWSQLQLGYIGLSWSGGTGEEKR